MVKVSSLAFAVLFGAASSGVGVAQAQSASQGVIFGWVMECAPGPVVASPPAPAHKPQPLTVTLYLNGVAYRRERVSLPTKLPWRGSFSFTVAPATYEVVSSYQHRSRWVSVSAGERVSVNFTTMACPL